MLNKWQTFPVQLGDGLITTDSPLSQGVSFPGSATKLLNFEVSQDGGYRRIKGYNKFDPSPVPSFGLVVVDGSEQTGTSLRVKGTSIQLPNGTTFTVAGVLGTYTVVSATFDLNQRTSTISLTPALDSSPANAAVVTFPNVTSSLIEGVFVLTDGTVFAKRGGDCYTSIGIGWTLRSVPNFGSVQVDGGAQSGGTLSVKNIAQDQPHEGNLFTVAGIDRVYTVISATNVTTGQSVLTIHPNLSSSPTDEAAITWLSSGLKVSTGKMRGVVYRIGSECDVTFVDGTNNPFKIRCATSTFFVFTNVPTEVEGASHVAFVRSTLFFGKSSVLTFSVPAEDDNFDPGDGAGQINTGDLITSLFPFKNSLVIFGRNRIRVLTGSSLDEFNVTSLTEKIGCIATDSVQEVGGDVVFLSTDGLRFLSDIDRSGDFAVNLASRQIRREIQSLSSRYNEIHSVVLSSKSQYRIFGYSTNLIPKFSEGFAGTQFLEQSQSGLRWSFLQGFKVRVGHSTTTPTEFICVFANNSGYVYRMDVANSFDGEHISWVYKSPDWSITDPLTRKTLFKVNMYAVPEGTFEGTFNLFLDFKEIQVIQPKSLLFGGDGTNAATYGNPNSIYGTSVFGGQTRVVFNILTTGAGHNFSVQLIGRDSNPPFALDEIVLEFSQQGRR